jgi:hypothetical protein
MFSATVNPRKTGVDQVCSFYPLRVRIKADRAVCNRLRREVRALVIGQS